MSVKDDGIQPSSTSFWEIGNYKRTVKRIENGYKLCDSLKDLIEQRSEIEHSYAKQLLDWSKKWHKFLENGQEYGTMKASWQGILSEAEELNRVHNSMADNAMQQVHGSIKQWQKEQFHKSIMTFREVKEADDNFRKAQKPWAKRYKKVMTSKQDYDTACKHEKSTSVQENNAKGDTSVSLDQQKKLQDKLEKCRKDVEVTRRTYEASLQDLNSSNAKYIEDMTEVFNSCQDMERKRLDFFKEMLFGLHKCLDLSHNTIYDGIYEDLYRTIESSSAEQDLRWWSNSHGISMAMDWPKFVEYTPEMQNISKRGKTDLDSGGGITITSIKHTGDYIPASTNHNLPQSYNQPTASSHTDDRPTNSEVHNPFTDGDEWDDEDNYLVDDGRPGVAVRALYDYEAIESDELSLTCGDVFTKLDEPNEQGWCKGRKDGKVGLYPADYAEVI